MSSEHSQWSASRFDRLIRCPGSVAIEQMLEDPALVPDGAVLPVVADRGRSSVFAAEGTAAHKLLEDLLQGVTEPEKRDGEVIEVDGFFITVDADMIGHVRSAEANLKGLSTHGGVQHLLSETKLDYSKFLGLPEGRAWGTADALLVDGSNLIVYDFKYGRGFAVQPEENPQAMLYALGAMHRYEAIIDDVETVTIVIDQPRNGGLKIWETTPDALRKWAVDVATPAVSRVKVAISTFRTIDDKAWCDAFLHAPDERCPFCPAAALHPGVAALAAQQQDAGVPADSAALSDSMKLADVLEDWIKAIRAEVEARLIQNIPVPGFKLVEGRKGARRWNNPTEVEGTFLSMRIPQAVMYDRKLISPTTAEKLAKAATIGPRQWAQLQELITRSEGKASVAPTSDPRAPISSDNVADDFD